MREISLSRGLVAVIDDRFYDEISKYSWSAKPSPYSFYAVRSEHYTLADGRRRCRHTQMHRSILELSGVAPGRRVDHRDGNGLNNQLSNLRPADAAKNNYNSRLRKDNSSGYKGVRLTRNGNWEARIRHNRRLISLGRFVSPELAAVAYDRAAIELFGDFALTNAQMELSRCLTQKTNLMLLNSQTA